MAVECVGASIIFILSISSVMKSQSTLPPREIIINSDIHMSWLIIDNINQIFRYIFVAWHYMAVC